jgi:hypothetical protein
MKRIISLLGVAALVAAMMVASALPAFAQVDFRVKTPSVTVDSVPVEGPGVDETIPGIEQPPVHVDPTEIEASVDDQSTPVVHQPSREITDEQVTDLLP